MRLRTALTYRVALTPTAVAERFAARPELRTGGPLCMERRSWGLVVRYDRKRIAYEAYELMPQQLWLEMDERGRCLYVKVRVVNRLSPRGLTIATVFALTHFAGNVLTELADLGETRRRRASERMALWNLAAAILDPLHLGAPRGPFRE